MACKTMKYNMNMAGVAELLGCHDNISSHNGSDNAAFFIL